MDILELVKEYVKPELLILVIVLYFIGAAVKNSEFIKDKYIPIILGIVGILIAGIYVVATSDISGYKEVLISIFTSITQGILVAGLSVYANQIVKQKNKEE